MSKFDYTAGWIGAHVVLYWNGTIDARSLVSGIIVGFIIAATMGIVGWLWQRHGGRLARAAAAFWRETRHG